MGIWRFSAVMVVLAVVGGVRGAPPTTATTAPASTTTAPATTRESPASAIERKLDRVVAEIAWSEKPLGEALAALQTQMNVNLAVHWAALESIGLRPETPVSFRVRGLTFGQALRILIDGLATEKGRVNYAVNDDDGGGVLEISTMEAFAKDRRAKFFPARAMMVVKLEGASINAEGIPRSKPEVMLEVLERELIDSGEVAKTFKLTHDEKTGRLLYAGSLRGQMLLERLFPRLTDPARPGAIPIPAIMPGLAKATAEKLKAKVTLPAREHTIEDLASYLSDVGKTHVVVMPGAVAKVEKRTLGAGEETTLGAAVAESARAFGLVYEINRDGVIVLARREQIAWHDVLCGYDVRETVKTLGKDPGVTKAGTALIAAVKKHVKEARGVAMVDGVLVFRAPAEVHRGFGARFDAIVSDAKNP